MQANLSKNKNIASVVYISPEEGLKQFAQTDALREAIATLDKNPLPGVMVITPIDNQTPDQLNTLFTNLKEIPLVDIGQLDLTWLRRLYDIIIIGKRLAYLLSIIFGLGVTLIIGNTIRLIMQSKRDEINVMKLVGATKSFIRRPLLYRGTLYGILGGIISWKHLQPECFPVWFWPFSRPHHRNNLWCTWLDRVLVYCQLANRQTRKGVGVSTFRKTC